MNPASDWPWTVTSSPALTVCPVTSPAESMPASTFPLVLTTVRTLGSTPGSPVRVMPPCHPLAH